MKQWLLAGALAAVGYGGLALAEGGSAPLAQNDQSPYYAPPSPGLFRGPDEGHRISVMAGAGIDGFWGSTGNMVIPGFSWGATVLGQPNRELGIEVGYSGAVHEARVYYNPTPGADIVRNGVDAILSLAPPWRLQPYLMAGYGLNFYTARGGTTALGFHSDTAGAIPMGGGIRTKAGHFTADARFDYNLGLGETFAPTGHANANRYQALVQVGGNF